MNVKIITSLAVLIFLSTASFSQLKVDQYGRIGMGTNWPNAEYKCHIKGNLLLTTYPSYPFYELKLKVGNGWPGTEIGSSCDNLAMWASWVGYNKLYVEQIYKPSDENLKSNISLIQRPLDKIMQLKPYLYDVKDNRITESGDSIEGSLRQYGFISQEVEKTLPDVKITEDMKDLKLMDYDQIIPLLVASMQEQNKQITQLQAQVAKMLAFGGFNGQNHSNANSNINNLDVSKLFNNSPNPFNNYSSINYYLSDSISQADIKIWDLQGVERKNFSLNPQKGNGSVTVQADELPNSGQYIFALITDSQIIDAKIMICNK